MSDVVDKIAEKKPGGYAAVGGNWGAQSGTTFRAASLPAGHSGSYERAVHNKARFGSAAGPSSEKTGELYTGELYDVWAGKDAPYHIDIFKEGTPKINLDRVLDKNPDGSYKHPELRASIAKAGEAWLPEVAMKTVKTVDKDERNGLEQLWDGKVGFFLKTAATYVGTPNYGLIAHNAVDYAATPITIEGQKGSDQWTDNMVKATIEGMRITQNNSAAMIHVATASDEWSKEAALAGNYLNDLYTKSKVSWGGAGSFVVDGILLGPETWLTAGVGTLATTAAKIPLKEGLKEVAKQGFKASLKSTFKESVMGSLVKGEFKQAFKTLTKPLYMSAAAEGGVQGSLGAHSEQKLKIAGGFQDQYNVSQTVMGGAIGGVAGFGLAGLIPSLPKLGKGLLDDTSKGLTRAIDWTKNLHLPKMDLSVPKTKVGGFLQKIGDGAGKFWQAINHQPYPEVHGAAFDPLAIAKGTGRLLMKTFVGDPEGMGDVGWLWKQKGHFWKRITSAEFYYHAFTKDLFTTFDNMKSTSIVKLITDADSSLAVRNSTPGERDLNFFRVFPTGHPKAGQEMSTAGALADIQSTLSDIAGGDTSAATRARLNDAVSYLGDQIHLHNKGIADIEATPGSSSDLVGGSATARLAIKDAKTHFTAVETYYNFIKSSTSSSHWVSPVHARRILTHHGSAVSDLNNFTTALLGYTRNQVGEGGGRFGTPTQYRIDSPIGLVERELTEAEKVTARTHGITDFDYKPGSNIYTNNVGHNGVLTDEEKFAMTAYGKWGLRDILPSDAQNFESNLNAANTDILKNFETLLKRGDRNRVVEALKWIAVQYAHPKNGYSRHLGISDKLSTFIEKNGNPALWDNELTQILEYGRGRQQDLGANNIREAWAEAFPFVRNRLFGGDHKNELTNQSNPGEFRDARKWKFGLGLPVPFPRFAAKGAPYHNLWKFHAPFTHTYKRIGGRVHIDPIVDKLRIEKGPWKVANIVTVPLGYTLGYSKLLLRGPVGKIASGGLLSKPGGIALCITGGLVMAGETVNAIWGSNIAGNSISGIGQWGTQIVTAPFRHIVDPLFYGGKVTDTVNTLMGNPSSSEEKSAQDGIYDPLDDKNPPADSTGTSTWDVPDSSSIPEPVETPVEEKPDLDPSEYNRDRAPAENENLERGQEVEINWENDDTSINDPDAYNDYTSIHHTPAHGGTDLMSMHAHGPADTAAAHGNPDVLSSFANNTGGGARDLLSTG
ncbi:MAG: hypothetical protein K9G62_08965, partial [Alphaproteobacteria bacterium]|nr:hypothetical protein [Alphaproteobacteria bacterium]